MANLSIDLKYTLYESSVQDPEADVDFFTRVYKDARNKKLLRIREDFCGTFVFCCEWVKSDKKRHATGVDLSSEPLEYGKKHHLAKLSKEQAQRVKILQQNVMDPTKEKYEMIAASNFSYFIFKERALLLKYFKSVHAALDPKGVFILDHFGGPGSAVVLKERRKIKLKGHKYQYIWECKKANLFTGEALFFIHFKDTEKKKTYDKAFSYDWRLWTIPEIKDVLNEAGFKKITTYKDMDDDYEIQDCNQPDDDSWLAQIAAMK